jgi:hypothetical protein
MASATDYLSDYSEYKKQFNSYLQGTSKWLYETEVHRKCHDSPEHGALWIKVTADAEQSVLAATIDAKLAVGENAPVLFYFFRQIVAINHHPKSLTKGFIA